MANFAPASTIRIGRVPWDNSYRHVRRYQSAAAQAEGIASLCTASLSRGDYTYVRMNNSIRVQWNAERLYTYNYVMYQNANYGNKWFYAFITGCNYVNENCTELVLEIDVMQTWQFDWTLKRCFVEREHVSDDAIGANVVSEPGLELVYQTQTFTTLIAQPQFVVLCVNSYPRYTVATLQSSYEAGNVNVSGGMYHGEYSACKYIVYDMRTQEGRDKLSKDVRTMNATGCADGIADAFTATVRQFNAEPTSEATHLEPLTVSETNVEFGSVPYERTFGDAYQLKTGMAAPESTRYVNRPKRHGEYVPRNNKLLTYPFCYAEVGDFMGGSHDYRFEWGNGGERLAFTIQTPCSPDGGIFVSPNDYNGLNGDTTPEVFVGNWENHVPWVYSTYQNWAAQNRMANTLAISTGIAGSLFSMVPSVSAAVGALGAGAKTTSLVRGASGGLRAESANERRRRIMSDMGGAVMGVSEERPHWMAGAGAGLMGLASTTGNIDRMSKVPNTARGSIGGNSNFQCGYSGVYFRGVTLVDSFAEIIDGFFDMYGYEVDSVKVPSLDSRPCWNYVKCSNSCNIGNIPADDMAAINAVFDSGVTFWHTDDVGNYSLDNTLK